MWFALAVFPLAALTTLMAGLQALQGEHDLSPNPLGFAMLAVAFWLQGTTVLADDAGAFAGLLVALTGTTLSSTGNARYDAFAAMGIGLLLGVAALSLAAQATMQSPPDELDVFEAFDVELAERLTPR
jgi:hypothetical protein